MSNRKKFDVDGNDLYSSNPGDDCSDNEIQMQKIINDEGNTAFKVVDEGDGTHFYTLNLNEEHVEPQKQAQTQSNDTSMAQHPWSESPSPTFSVPMHEQNAELCNRVEQSPYSPRPITKPKFNFHKNSNFTDNFPIKSEMRNNRIELSKNFKELSLEFINALGHNNVHNIYSNAASNLRKKIFIALLDYEAFLARRSNPILSKLMDNKYDLDAVKCVDSGQFLRWESLESKRNGIGFVRLIRHLCTIPELDAAATLAKILGMNYNYIFQTYKLESTDGERHADSSTNSLPKNLFLADDLFAKFIHKTPIVGNDGAEIASFVLYEADGINFVLPAGSKGQHKPIGYHQAQSMLLNQCKIEDVKTESIIFCLDPRLAIELNNAFKECRINPDPGTIVTGHVGNDLNTLPWNFLDKKHVILIPPINAGWTSSIGLYHKHMENIVESLRIYPFWLLPYHRGATDNPLSLANSTEQTLFNAAIFLPEIETISQLIKKIKDESLTFKEYKTWGKKIGIFYDGKTKTQNQSHKGPKSMDRLGNASNVLTDVKASICDFFPRDGVCLIQGKKNSGKSMVVTMIAAMLASPTNTSIFGKNDTSCKVLLVDGESTERVLAQRIGGFGLIDHPNFGFIAQRMEDSGTTWAAMDLNSDLTRTELAEEILVGEYVYVIVDNLTCLTKNAANYYPDFVSTLFDWAAELNTRNIGVIFVNHLHDEDLKQTKDAKSRGSKELYIRAQTELRIIGKDEIMDNETLNDAFGSHIEDGFLVSGIHIRSCKNAPQEERTIRWVKHKVLLESITSLGTSNLEGHKINADKNEEPKTVCQDKAANQRIGVGINVDSLEGLTNNEIRILKIFIDRYNDGQTEPEPRSIFDCPDKKNTSETTRNSLNKLAGIGIVKKIEINERHNNFQLADDFEQKIKEHQDSLQSEKEMPTS